MISIQIHGEVRNRSESGYMLGLEETREKYAHIRFYGELKAPVTAQRSRSVVDSCIGCLPLSRLHQHSRLIAGLPIIQPSGAMEAQTVTCKNATGRKYWKLGTEASSSAVV